LVLETIFSYPTWAEVELLHKNTPIRERDGQRRVGEERRKKDGSGDRHSEWERDGELSLSH